MKENKLAFLMCSERSGSNFITSVLNGHSKICGPGVKHIISPVARNLFRYGALDNSKNWDLLLEDILELLNVNFVEWEVSFSIELLNGLAKKGDVVGLLENIFLLEAKANGKNFCFVKENLIYEYATFLLLNFPSSKYIYQVRDPRDMALSWKKHVGHRGGVVSAAKQWRHDQRGYLMMYYELEKKGLARLLRYEDLITNPERTLRSALAFLGQDYEGSILEFHLNESVRKRAKKEKAWENLSSGVLTQNKNKFKHELTEEEVSYVERICHYEMQVLGYQIHTNQSRLENISVEQLDKFEQEEINKLPFQKTEGAKNNYKAKNTFYKRGLACYK